MSTSPTRIIELRAENFKRLKALTIRPQDGSAVVEITGKNGQGKSSVLDLIQSILGGKKLNPIMPVREGTEAANGVLELDNGWLVERVWKADGITELVIKNNDGAKFQGPQDLLDNLYGDTAFDPLAFTRMEPKKQISILKQVASLDFDEIDGVRLATFDERTGVHRELKAAQAQLTGMPAMGDDVPDEELSFADLSQQLQDAINRNRENEAERARLKSVKVDLQNMRQIVADLEAKLARARKDVAELEEIETNQTLKVDALKDVDVESLQKQLANAEETNRRVRAKQVRVGQQAKVDLLAASHKQLTERIEELDEQKKKLLQEASFPVPGLSICEHGIIYNGIPFDQASSAEQLRVSVAMGIALNPQLKVMLVRDGSLLDSAGRQLLAEMAEAANAQVWMERATDGEPVGIVIEDGEIKEPEPEPIAAQ